uniref:Proliferating cell nuclear antigen PCNA N-terminal domain-containing protein n=1 Tax=Leersia perrieri TaxID=77586 RepID=A0A0D9VNC3_9ORYZ
MPHGIEISNGNNSEQARGKECARAPGRKEALADRRLLRLVQASLLKNALEAISDLFSNASLNFSGTGLELQAMDTSRVALILRADAFDHYHCDRDLSMGLNLADMANKDDIITIKADDVTFTFQSPAPGIRVPGHSPHALCNKLSCFGDRDTPFPSPALVVIKVDKERIEFFTVGTKWEVKNCLQAHPNRSQAKRTYHYRNERTGFPGLWPEVHELLLQVTIRLSSELPAVFEYKIAVAEMGYIRYYMWPMKDEMQN